MVKNNQVNPLVTIKEKIQRKKKILTRKSQLYIIITKRKNISAKKTAITLNIIYEKLSVVGVICIVMYNKKRPI